MYFKSSFFLGNIEKITGYLEKKFLSREITWDQLIYPDDLPNILENAKKIRTIPHYSAVQEFRIIHKDKKIAWIQEHFQNICDNQNKPIKVSGVIFDITEQKKAELKLKESEEKYRNFVQNIQGIAYQGYQDFSATFFEGAVEEITGYTTEDFMTERIKWDQIIHPDDVSRVQKKVESFHSISAESDSREYQIVRKDGETKWVSENIHKKYDYEKKMEGAQGIIFDITERKKAEEEIRNLKESYERLTDNANVAIFRVKIKGKDIIHSIPVNPAAERLFGYSKEEWSSNNDLGFKIIHPDYVEKLKQINDEIYKNKKPIKNAVLNWIAKDGREVIVEYTIIPILDVDDEIVSFESIGVDITERMKTKQELKESEEKHRTFMETAKDFMHIIDDKGKIIYANRDFIGYKKKELMNMHITELIAEETLPIFAPELKNLIKNGRITLTDLYCKGKDGTKIIGELNVVAMYGSDGKFKGARGIFKDITERKKIEQKLKDSEEKYRNFVQKIQGIAFQGYQDFSFAFIDGAVEEITGYNAEDFETGKVKWIQIIYPDDTATIRKKVDLFHSTSAEAESLEYRIIRKNGEIRWILNQVQKIYDSKKKLEAVQGIMIENTQRKKVEEKLKELSKLKSEFLRRASHELKTPLISIKGFSDLILSLYADQLDTGIISNLREINDGCERLQNIINNLLKTSRLESPELKPKLQREDLSFLIKFCVHELESLAKMRKQSIKLEIINDLYVNIEKEEIHRVLSNLITNAIKYTPPMGKIEVKTELEGDFMIISVKDNGIGFTNEQKKIIFQKFGKIERYGQGLDLGIDGTGLGLYISKRIVESHGGKIWMESEGKSKGSTFYFTLPIVK